MQANPLLTATDKTAAASKPGKSNASSTPEISFNQMLNKEISGAKKPEMDIARPASKPAPAPKNNNNVNSSNNSSNSSNKLASKENNATTPATTEKTDAGNNNGDVAKEEDSDVKKEDSISEQMLALVGNLAAAPVLADTVKKPVTTEADTSKNDSLAAITSTDATAAAGLSDIDTVASLAKAAMEDQGKTAAKLSDSSVGKEQFKPDSPTNQADVAAMAAQLMASKADGKASGKLAENVPEANTPAIDKALAKLNDPLAKTTETTAPVPTDSLSSKSTATAGTEKPVETANSEVKTDELSLGKTATDKLSDTRPAANTSATPTTFANDIAQAKDAMADRIAEVKTSAPSKDGQQIIAPPAIAATTVSSAQLNAAILASEQVAPRVGSNGWDKAVGQKVVWMVGEGLQSAELTLNPPDLGPLQVVLKVSNEQASASFSSAQPEVREALEAALPRLKQMLNDAGVQLTGFSVNSQAAGQGQGQNFAQQQPRSLGSTRTGPDLSGPAINTANTAPTRIQTNNGLVDTFA